MEEMMQSQEMKSEKPLRTAVAGTTSDFQIDAKPRTRFNLTTNNKNPGDDVSCPANQRQQHGLQRKRSGASTPWDEGKQETDQPRLWFCGVSSDTKKNSDSLSLLQQQQGAERYFKRHVRRGKDSPSNPQSPLAFADNEMKDNDYPGDDMSGIVSKDVSTFTSKTVVANNRGKKLDFLQPIYDRMGLYTKKEKKGLRDALADLFMMR